MWLCPPITLKWQFLFCFDQIALVGVTWEKKWKVFIGRKSSSAFKWIVLCIYCYTKIFLNSALLFAQKLSKMADFPIMC